MKGRTANPVEEAIRDLLGRGRTARIAVDALSEGVDVPDNVRARWGHTLILDLDPGMPLNLTYGDAGLHVTLSFHPMIYRCAIPYCAIYAVLDRTTGTGALFREHIPAEREAEAAREADDTEQSPKRARSSVKPVPAPRDAASRDDPDSRRRKFRVIRGGKR